RGVRGVAPWRADRARDHQPRLLVRVLRELRARHHARAAAAPRHAEIPAAGERLRPRGDPLSGAVSGAPQAAARDGAGARRCGRDAQRERRQAELAAVYLPGLRSDCPSLLSGATSRRWSASPPRPLPEPTARRSSRPSIYSDQLLPRRGAGNHRDAGPGTTEVLGDKGDELRIGLTVDRR